MLFKRWFITNSWRNQKVDALVVGSPIYWEDFAAAIHVVLERLWFSNYAYNKDKRDVFGKKIKTAFIWTMNVDEETCTFQPCSFCNDKCVWHLRRTRCVQHNTSWQFLYIRHGHIRSEFKISSKKRTFSKAAETGIWTRQEISLS